MEASMAPTSSLRYPLSTVATGAALAVTLVVLFVVCAVAQLLVSGVQVTHAWVGLFTAAPLPSLRAWVEGLLASIAFGWLAGTVFALVYNAVTGRE
jgi:hypothetical protein